MKTSVRRRGASIRARVLSIALIPSITLLLVGVALAGYLIYDAIGVRDFANKIRNSERPALLFFTSAQEERRLTLREVSGAGNERVALVEQRAKTDAAGAGIMDTLRGLAGEAPESVQRNIGTAGQLVAQLPQVRQRADAGQLPLTEAYAYYNRILDQFAEGLTGLAQEAPDAEAGYLRVIAVPLFVAADGMQRADALAAAGLVSGGLDEAGYRAYVEQIGAYHAQLTSTVPRMIPEVKARYDQLLASDAWQKLTTVENAFLRGPQSQLPIAENEWRAASRQVGDSLMGLFVQQSSQSTQKAIDDGENTLITSIIAGALALLFAVAVFLLALRLSNRLIGRLARLREDTLDLADTRLPELVGRLRRGEDVDLDSDVAVLDHGSDEIGQVADAFNTAQQTAIAAAVDEAKIREGTKTVFLNIAHRSQVIVHRQLKVLDQAERRQEDPDQLETLFQLDHLSTRARRNAENLIILGGGQPGRQWRNPVGIGELARGAAAETEDFARVRVSGLPAIAVNGPVVGDLMHLLAELIDNATSFSPPESRVEVRGNIVGRGVVLEVEDQGLGIEPEHCAALNGMLADPPDFGIMALSSEPRLGLFVVARLAVRHGISVTLRESAYGGTRAIVLVRSDLLSPLPEPEEPVREEPEAPQWPEPALVEALQSVPDSEYDDYEPEPEPEPEPAGNGYHEVDEPTRQNLFRPHVPVPPRQEAPPTPPPPAPPRPPRSAGRAPAEPPVRGPGGPGAPGRPPLPQRRRQQNLVPQLRNDLPGVEREQDRGDSPEMARNRLAAFQQGTRRAREQDPDGHDDRYGD
ncbi:ATP-binding protein [Amycolatopsis suaedae]|uniref:histidine kinase n=1 Tax=Amycolatopsis suaedae TaxID=2510978 RepID=A0A4V2EKW3_9PSEU|nr:ATP-binding protein [Amycolatopsis suaedae]RZQ59465.1 HAMP domain-containing protein [Amycolatopsis suaedae]